MSPSSPRSPFIQRMALDNSLKLSEHHFPHEQYSIKGLLLSHKVIMTLKYMNVLNVLYKVWKSLLNLKKKKRRTNPTVIIERLLSARHCTRCFAYVCPTQQPQEVRTVIHV